MEDTENCKKMENTENFLGKGKIRHIVHKSLWYISVWLLFVVQKQGAFDQMKSICFIYQIW